MSSRLSTSQPVTIETELIPLVDNFWLEANGQTEQWYYDNTGEYAPDRSIIPLIITPYIKATDTDSKTSYTPNFYTVEWYVQQWNGTAWVRTKVTNTTDTPANPFVIVGNTLKVNKNVESPQYGITIDCEATYIDPRDAGVTYPVRDSLTLTMNKDATVPYPKIQVLAESAQSFNPLKDSSAYDFKAEADWKGVNSDNGSQLYKADALGTEEIVSRTGTLPTTTPIIGNLRYGRGTGSTLKENQSFMFRQTSGGTVNPVPQNLAGIEKLKGNTVAWNQLVSLSGITALGVSSASSITNGWHCETTSKILQIETRTGDIDWISEHKYLHVFMLANSSISFSSSLSSNQCIAMDSGVKQRAYFQAINGWNKFIFTYTQASSTGNNTKNQYQIHSDGTQGFSVDILYPMLFDLTLMFGSGNEPSTVAEFEAMFPEPYYAYDAGRLLSFNPTGLKTVGFNLIDGWVENAYIANDDGIIRYNDQVNTNATNWIKVLPNTVYRMESQSDSARWHCWYDINKNFISGLNGYFNYDITSPSNAAYYRATIKRDAIGTTCFHLKGNGSKDNTYEPYWENTCPINITTLKGRATGSTTDVVMFPDGLCSAGSVFDEIDLKNGRAVKRIGKVDLGSKTWKAWVGARPEFGIWEYPSADPSMKQYTETQVGNLVCHKYVTTNRNTINNTDSNTGIIAQSAGIVKIKDLNYITDADTFKAAMSGVYLYYELATPIEYTFDPIPQGQFEWYGVSNGVEVKIDTLPSYVSGQDTDTLRVDALYDENMTVICRYKKYPWDTELIPQKEYRTVAWRVPNIDTIVVCKNGSSVNSASTGSYTFETIVNVKGEMISDQVKAANLRFRWKMRKSNTTTETDLGWGLTKSIPVSDLKNTVVNDNPVSTIVYCEVYLLGAYEPVTNNGVTTYERNINNN